jgi:hypothetical protein
VVGVPFLLFGSQETLAFCLTCVRARGLAQWLQTGTTEECANVMGRIPEETNRQRRVGELTRSRQALCETFN